MRFRTGARSVTTSSSTSPGTRWRCNGSEPNGCRRAPRPSKLLRTSETRRGRDPFSPPYKRNLGPVQKLIPSIPGKESVIPLGEKRVFHEIKFIHLILGDLVFGIQSAADS